MGFLVFEEIRNTLGIRDPFGAAPESILGWSLVTAAHGLSCIILFTF